MLNLHVGPDLGHTPDRIEKRKKPVPGWIQTHDVRIGALSAVLQPQPIVVQIFDIFEQLWVNCPEASSFNIQKSNSGNLDSCVNSQNRIYFA